MCGIIGLFDIKDEQKTRTEALKMARKIRHRGPDWSGSYSDEYCLLMHERLSIVDVEHGAQPLYDTNKENGGLVIHKDSHKHGYFDHTLEHPLGGEGWTQEYTHVDPSISKRFERIELEIRAGSAVLMHSSVLHCGYPNKKKGSVRITICERYNPLQKIPYLRNKNAPMKIPFTGVDYNKILD